MKSLYTRIKTPLWLIISGLFTSLPLIMTELGFLQWISIIPAAVMLLRNALDRGVGYKKLYGMGVLFFWAYYSLSFHWFFYMYPLDFANLTSIESIGVVVLACFGLGFFQAVQSALVFLFFGYISRSKLCKRSTMILPFCAAALWVVFEWWQTIGWWGVPWARLPLGQIDAVLLLRSSAILGSYFVTFIIVAVNFSFAISVCERRFVKFGAITVAVLFAVNLALGSAVTLSYNDDREKITVAAAQGNISSADKWSDLGLQSALDIYKRLTEDAADAGANVVIWPETALPYVLFDDEISCMAVSELAMENDITIILSAFTEEDGSEQNYNSMIEVKPDGSFGEKIYSKQKLVPFGEFVPMREFVSFIFPPLANIGMLKEDLLAGEESIIIESEQGRVGCALCFDSIYEDVIRDSVRNGAEIIAISTNDSWFSDSAALDMHNAQARLRAIESGRYVIRSANTGISAIIDPMGNVTAELGVLERGCVIGEAAMIRENTAYTYIGNIFAYICLAGVIFMLLNKCCESFKINFIKKS